MAPTRFAFLNRLLAPLVALLGAALAFLAAAQAPATHDHRFRNAEKWAQVFDDPARDAWQKPLEVIRSLKLAPNATVADIGSGTGYFAVRLAKALPQGRVYGVDTESDMVNYLAERARREGLANVVSLAGAPDDPGLPSKVDLVLLVNVYHHIGGRERYFRKLGESLAPGGRVAVIDFTLESPHGPPRRARIPAEQVKAEMARAGYAITEEPGILTEQFFLIFAPRR
jgi:SAM-dependent methyltransferase